MKRYKFFYLGEHIFSIIRVNDVFDAIRVIRQVRNLSFDEWVRVQLNSQLIEV